MAGSSPSNRRAQRPTGVRPVTGRSRARQAGHALLIVVVAMAITMIGMTVAMRVWNTVLKREKEDELIFRGRQYAQAIYLFRKFRGTLPTDLKQLEEKG